MSQAKLNFESTKTLWDFTSEAEMLKWLVGPRYGQNPKERIDDIIVNRKRIADGIVQKLKFTTDSVVIDLGSGTGIMASHIAKCVRQVYGYDISESYLDYCRSQFAEIQNLKFVKIQNLMFKEIGASQIDGIYSHAVFIHLNLYDIFWYFQEFARVVKPGGYVWFTLTAEEQFNLDPAGEFMRMAKFYLNDPSYYGRLVKFNSSAIVTEIAKQAGFKMYESCNGTFIFQK